MEYSDENATVSGREWTVFQRIGFRIAFIFFVLMSIPFSGRWYEHLFTMDWLHLHYRDIYDLARFSSGLPFFGNTLLGESLNGYALWLITLLVAIAGGVVWTLVGRKRKEYNTLYYWLLAIVRYRAGIGIIGFGFTKLLPVQMPYPSEGILSSNFGDFTPQKIFWLSIGIVPWYQIFTGVVEIAAGIMLFFRGTAAVGAALLIGALGSITYVNFAYDGGVHVYASYFVLLGSFVLAYYVPRLYRLFILERLTTPVDYFPRFTVKWQRYTRIALKAGILGVFVVLLFYLQWVNFLYDPYKQPSTRGVPELRGYYDVVEFRLNGKAIPYSPLDTVRWQEVTFEKWTSLTYRVNKPVLLDLSNGGGSAMRDINRTFEVAGVAGGRRVFYYQADTVNAVLYLQDKNRAVFSRRNARSAESGEGGGANENWISGASLAHMGDEYTRIDKRTRSGRRLLGIEEEKAADPPGKKMILNYSTADGSEVILRGINEKSDSLFIVLRRRDRKYVLSESTLEAGKY